MTVLIGIDVIENERFARAMRRRPRILKRVFTPAEREYCLARPDPVQHFAARFAAKEAVGKALGTGVVSWQEIEIRSEGRPRVRITGRTRRVAENAGASGLSVSMSHCGTVSVSVAVARATGSID
ncbi:MAG: holo-ACP synthase [Thermoleophilia bacterium]|nr:holo-ACP synthase [Thermoleophilia bacterium]